MRRVLACLCISLVCASCSEESAPVASPTLIQVGGTVEPQVGTSARDVAVDTFWAKVREASAAYPASSKTKLTHAVQTPTGPVVVEEEVVMSEYMRIWQEESKNAAARVTREAADSSKQAVSPARLVLRKRQGSGSSERPAIEHSLDEQVSKAKSELAASKRRRESLEFELEVERQRENRDWLIQELEAGIKSEREAEAQLEVKIKRLDSVEIDMTMARSGPRDSEGVERMPFGSGSFGPWGTGGDLPGR